MRTNGQTDVSGGGHADVRGRSDLSPGIAVRRPIGRESIVGARETNPIRSRSSDGGTAGTATGGVAPDELHAGGRRRLDIGHHVAGIYSE